MHKRNTLLLILLVLVAGTIIILKRTARKSNAQWTIGILQTATHPALNAVRDNFIREITQKYGDKADMIIYNAEGSANNMQTMAQSLRANRSIDLMFAIATPTAQALAGTEKERPIIFAAVTNPTAAGLIKPNVCGVTDMIDVKKQIELALALLPAIKTVALLFNKGEVNAVSMAQEMHTLLQEKNISVLEFGVTNESEIPAAAEAASRKADLILAPTDNTVASTISVITAIAHKYNKPVIVSDNMLVAQGALAAQGADYAQCGIQSAQLAMQILQEHKMPHELPLIAPGSKAVINKTEFDRLLLTIPATLQNVEFIQ